MAADQSKVWAQDVQRLGFTEYTRVFGSLDSPTQRPLPGDYLAEFVGPASTLRFC